MATPTNLPQHGSPIDRVLLGHASDVLSGITYRKTTLKCQECILFLMMYMVIQCMLHALTYVVVVIVVIVVVVAVPVVVEIT